MKSGFLYTNNMKAEKKRKAGSVMLPAFCLLLSDDLESILF